jgi:hypothetical protein
MTTEGIAVHPLQFCPSGTLWQAAFPETTQSRYPTDCVSAGATISTSAIAKIKLLKEYPFNPRLLPVESNKTQ